MEYEVIICYLLQKGEQKRSKLLNQCVIQVRNGKQFKDDMNQCNVIFLVEFEAVQPNVSGQK